MKKIPRQLARSADPDDYAEAIEALFDRDIEALGQAARVRTVERFAWNRVFEDLSIFYAQTSGRAEFAVPTEAVALN